MMYARLTLSVLFIAFTSGSSSCTRYQRNLGNPPNDAGTTGDANQAPSADPSLSGADTFPIDRGSIVGLGEATSCVALSSGKLKCWGSVLSNGLGGLNDVGINPGEMGDNLPFVSIDPGVQSVESGNSYSCALLATGAVKCWGSNALFGVLGQGNDLFQFGPPLNIPPIKFKTGITDDKVIQVSTGDSHACVLLDSGKVKCWGSNFSSELGYGAASGNLGDDPGEIEALGSVNLGTNVQAGAIATGKEFSCALLTTGAVKCWGTSFVLRGATNVSVPLQLDTAGKKAIGISAKYSHACLLLEDNSIACFGESPYGVLGPTNMPAIISLGTGLTPKDLCVGQDYSCAILTDTNNVDKVKCWGRNDFGQLGLETMQDVGTMAGELGDALPFVDLGAPSTTLSAIYCGYSHTCVLIDDKTMKCWGQNDQGQLGLGDKAARGTTPGQMGTNLKAVKVTGASQ